MIRELWTLVRMLFRNRPSDIRKKRMEVLTMKHFPVRGYAYMMWCGTIITRHTDLNISEKSYTHESIHAMQAESEHGDSWIRFYVNYVWHWLCENPFSAPASSAYYTNRYEVEAYAQEEHPEYLTYYNRKNLRGKYSIRHAKKLYKSLGGSRAWKRYVKSI